MKRKNFRKVPDIIVVKSNGIAGDMIIASAISISKQEVIEGKYNHLDMKILNGELHFPKEIIPKPEIGKYSRRNIQGHSTILRDLPKVLKMIDLGDRYPYGDTSKTPFNLTVSRMVYQRAIEEPKNKNLVLDLINEDDNTFSIRISVNEILNKNDEDFDDEILFNLNLLQENVGSSDVYRSDMTKEEFLATLNVTWEFLPPGTRDRNLESILEDVRILTSSIRNEILDKYDFLSSLNPVKFIKGRSGMLRYFGAMFLDDLVVFETLNYGYAVYIMYDNWDQLSSLSRTQLLKKESRDFHKVVHKGKWKERVVELVSQKIKGSA